MPAQDFTVDDILADGAASGASPEVQASALQHWRADLLEYGREKHDPEEFWKRSSALNSDVETALSTLRDEFAVSVIAGLPEDQRQPFLTKYAESKGDPTKMVDDQWATVAGRLNEVQSDPTFLVERLQPFQIDAEGKPLADVSLMSKGDAEWTALVRPLKEGGKSFTLNLKRHKPEEMKAIAEAAKAKSADLLQTMKDAAGGDPGAPAAVNDIIAEMEEADDLAKVYESGDQRVIAGLEASKLIKDDPEKLSQIADEQLFDRFQSGLFKASINTGRAVGMVGQIVTGKPPTDPFPGTEEALAQTSEDTARSFVPTTGEKVATSAVESLGQMAPTLGSLALGTGAARLLGAKAVASEVGAATSMAPASVGAEYGAILEKAKVAREQDDEETAQHYERVSRWSALLQGAIDTGTEMMFGESAAVLRGGRGVAKRLLTTPLKEGTEGLIAGVAERSVKQPAFYTAEDQQPLSEGAGVEFLAGAAAGGGFAAVGAVGDAANRVVQKINKKSDATVQRIIREKHAAVSAAPDSGTAATTAAIFDAAADMAILDEPPTVSAGTSWVDPDAQTESVGVDVSPAPTQQSVSVEGSAPPAPTDQRTSDTGEATGSTAPPVSITPILETELENATTSSPAEGTSATEPTSEGVPIQTPTNEVVEDSAPELRDSEEDVQPIGGGVAVEPLDIANLRRIAGSSIGEAGLRRELYEYSLEELQNIAQQLGVEDASPALLAKALRYQAKGNTRYSVASEPVTRSLPSSIVQRAVRAFGRAVTTINDPNARTPEGTAWAARADRADGTITVNLAFIKDAADLNTRLEEEAIHLVYNDPTVQAEVAALEAAITPAMLADVTAQGYNPSERTEEAAVRLIQRLARQSVWRRFLNAMRNAFRRLFRKEPTNQQVELAARKVLETALSNRPAVRGEGVRFSGALDAEYLAAVESGDMEKAQRMVDAVAKTAGMYERLIVFPKPTSQKQLIEKISSIGVTVDEGGGYTMNLDTPDGYVWKSTGNGTISIPWASNHQTWWKNAFNDVWSEIQRGLRLADQDEKAEIRHNNDDDSWGAFTDPIVRDASGNVIPLSQRFGSTDDIRYSRAQVFGKREVGQEKPQRSFATSTAAAKASYFDGDQPISDSASEDAWLKALEWSDSTRGNAVVAQLLSASDGDELVVGIAQGELLKYATQLAKAGDPSLVNYFNANSNLWAMYVDSQAGASATGATLAGRSRYPQSSFMDALSTVNENREAAETKELPKGFVDAVGVEVNGTKLDKPAVRKVKRAVKDKKGETLEDKVEKLAEPEEEEESKEDKTAKGYIDRIDKTQVEVLLPDVIENPVLKYIRQQETLPSQRPKDAFVTSTAAGLRSLGVSEDVAINTAERVWLRKEVIRDNAVRRAERVQDVTRAAEQYISSYDQSQTEVVIPEKVVNPATKILRAAQRVEGNVTEDQFMRSVVGELQLIGVTQPVAINAARRAWAARQTWWANRQLALAEKARREEDTRATRIADQLLTRFAEAQSDTPELTDKQKNPVRELVREAMKPTAQFSRDQLVDALQRLGVAPETAVPLAQAVWTQRRFNEEIRVARASRDLATGERGSLRPLEDMLADAPAPQQQSPEWRKRAAQTYFTQLGLSSHQAAAAARLYDTEFAARLQDALEAAIERVSSQNAPWKKRELSEGKKRKMLTDLEKLRKAVRLGVVNPDTEWHSELAKSNGWHGFTPQQVQRLGEIDALLSDEALPTYRKAQLQAEVQEMMGRAQLPPTLGDYVVSSYTLSALSGLPTFFVQFSAIIAIFRDFVAGLITNPAIASKAMVASLDAFGKEASFALRNNVFTYAVGEHLRDSAPPLRTLLESGIADWQSEDHKARGLGKMIVGLQTYVGQLLSAVDQGAIAAAQVYKTALFTTSSLRALGWTRDDAGHVVTAAFDARNAAYQDALARGLPPDEAGVAANESFRNAVGGRLREINAQMAEDVEQGVRSDALGPVGRLDQHTGNTEEGMLSYPINIVLDSLNHAYRAGGWRALMARVMFGFISIPFRAARWFSGYSPYGFVRYRIHRYRVSQNKETLWKQSFGTRVQEQQRIRDAIMGTALMSIVAALAGRSGDDDPDKEELKIIVTGKGPSDPAARDIWMKRFQPYSFNVKVGKAYLQMNLGRAFESVAWPLAWAGAMDDVALNRAGRVARGSERSFDEGAEFIGSYLGSLSQRAAFQSLGKVAASTTKGSSELGKEVGQQIVFASSALLPWKSALQSLTRLASEPVDRSTMAGIVIANTPIAGPMLGRPAVNVLGDPIGDNTLHGKLYREGVPLVARFPTDERSRRVYDLILEKGKGPTMTRRSDVESKYGTLTDEQFYKYRVERGRMIKAEMTTGADRLRLLDAEDYGEALEKISRRVNPKAAKAVGLKTAPK